ncbi:MAG: hypothetical protein LBR60_08100 [Fibrobacter sp.]|jgi:tetratricopeptide (TPR) repeat protein|nr:hypothetical protein [Fibrobacter sp.]
MRHRILFILAFFSLILISCSSSKNVPAGETNVAGLPAEPAVKRDLETAHGSFLRALQMMQKDEPGFAEPFLKRAMEADPTSRYLAFTLAALMDGRGESKEALAVAQKANLIKGKPNSSEYALLASLHRQQIHVDSAKFYYRKAIELSEDNLSALYEYSLLLEIIKDKEELARIYAILLPSIGYPNSLLKRQIMLLDELKQDSLLLDLLQEAYFSLGDATYYYARLERQMELKQFDSVIAGTEILYRQNPADPVAVMLEFAARLRSQEPSLALDTLRKRYAMGAQTPDILATIGDLELELGEIDSAKAHFKLLAKDSSQADEAHFKLSGIAREQNDTLTAIREAELSAKLSPAYFRHLAWTYFYYDQFPKVYPVLDSLLQFQHEIAAYWAALPAENKEDSLRIKRNRRKISSEQSRASYLYAVTLVSEARVMEKKFQDSLARNKRLDADELYFSWLFEKDDSLSRTEPFLFNYAANLERLGKNDESIEIFKKIVSKNPKSAGAWNYLGYMLVDLNRNPEEVAEGTAYIDRALKLDPANDSYIDSKAWALYRTGHFKEALEWMEKINAADIQSDIIYYEHFALICEALGFKERAKGYYEKILALNPKHKFAREKLKALSP